MTKSNAVVQYGFDSCGFPQLPNVGRQFVGQSLPPATLPLTVSGFPAGTGNVWQSPSPGNRHRLKNIGHVDRDRGNPSFTRQPLC